MNPSYSDNCTPGPADHSLRHSLVRELHARPFLRIDAPCRLAFIALKPEDDNAHSAASARAQLHDFLTRFNAPEPKEGALYFFADLGGTVLRWENHSEFATYTLFTYQQPTPRIGEEGHPFANDLHDMFPEDWFAAHAGRVVTSVSVNIDRVTDQVALEARMSDHVRHWFGPDSTYAAAYVTDRSAAIAGDFNIDNEGHIRFAVLACESIGPGRIGRVVQRLLEAETYRAMSMLTLPVARKVLGELRDVDIRLSKTVEDMRSGAEDANTSLHELLQISADLTVLSSQSSFRFSATRAYEQLVRLRIELLREERLLGRQLLSEFLKRRYNPAMRTCRAASEQLEDMAERAAKASELLGTRVSVTTTAQNRQLLARMDDRAAQQARLQETVEGISVVAISYYAVSLLTYLLAPLTKVLPVSKTMLAAALVLPVFALVWFFMHRLKEKLIRAPHVGGDGKQ